EQGWENCVCNVVSRRVAPGFEVMRLGNMPMTERRGFIVVETQVHAQPHARELFGKAEIGRRGKNRIAAEHDKYLYLPGLHVSDQRAERGRLIQRACLHWVGTDDGVPPIIEYPSHR